MRKMLVILILAAIFGVASSAYPDDAMTTTVNFNPDPTCVKTDGNSWAVAMIETRDDWANFSEPKLVLFQYTHVEGICRACEVARQAIWMDETSRGNTLMSRYFGPVQVKKILLPLSRGTAVIKASDLEVNPCETTGEMESYSSKPIAVVTATYDEKGFEKVEIIPLDGSNMTTHAVQLGLAPIFFLDDNDLPYEEEFDRELLSSFRWWGCGNPPPQDEVKIVPIGGARKTSNPESK